MSASSDSEDFAARWARELAEEEARIWQQIERDAEAIRRATEAQIAAENSEPEAEPDEEESGYVARSEFVPQQLEGQYIVRDEQGMPALRFVSRTDRLAIQSPRDGGVFVNPRGVGLRRIGLYSCHVRGTRFFLDAYCEADLRPGSWVRLERERDNSHDPNATAIFAAGVSNKIGYVQRGRTAAVAERLDASEDLCGVSLRGPAPGQVEGATWLVLGSRLDLRHMMQQV